MTLDICQRNVEFRAADSAEGSDGRNLDGYAAVFGAPTVIDSWEGRFTETIAKGAFRKTLRERKNVLMQWNHGGDSRVGHTPIGHYTELVEDDHGLRVKGRLFDNDLVEPIRQAIEAGAITGMSFKFRVVRDDWTDNMGKRVKPDELYELLYDAGERGPLQRNIKEVQLFEAGPVSTPAYDQTSVGVRSVSEEDRQKLVDQYRQSIQAEEREIQEWLAAEERWAKDYSDWVDAETTWRTSVTDWLAAEQAHETSQREADAARETGTSERTGENPQTTPPDLGTSNRDDKKESTQRDAAPRKIGKVMNIHELRAREKALLATLTGLGEEFRDAEMPAEKAEAFDAAESELGEVRGKIEAIEARAEKMKAYAVETPAATERGNDNRTPAFHKDRDIFDIDATRMEARSAEDFVARIKDDAKRAVDGASYSRATSTSKAQERAMDLLRSYDDENGTLAKRILATGSATYERAFGKAMKAASLAGLTIEEQRAMSLGTDSEGGFAVPFQLDPTVILTNDGYVGDIRSVARVETIVGKEWQGITSAGIAVSRDGSPAAGEIGRTTGSSSEGEEARDNSFALAQPKVRTVRVQGFVPFSLEIEQDWGGLRGEITRMLNDAKGREENAAFTLGAGDGLTGMPQGIVGGLSGGSIVAPATVETFAAADVYALELALAPRWRGNGKFMANRSIYSKIRQFGTTDGHALWERIGNGQPSRLLGYETLENSDMDGTIETSGVVDNKILLFADFSQFIIVDRIGMSVELIPHLFDVANNRPNGKRGIYAVWRNNAKVLVPEAFKLLNVNSPS